MLVRESSDAEAVSFSPICEIKDLSHWSFVVFLFTECSFHMPMPDVDNEETSIWFMRWFSLCRNITNGRRGHVKILAPCVFRSVYHLPFIETSTQLMERWSTKISPLLLTPFQPKGWWWWLRLFIVMGYMVITPEQSSHMVKMKCIGKYFTWVTICFGWK